MSQIGEVAQTSKHPSNKRESKALSKAAKNIQELVDESPPLFEEEESKHHDGSGIKFLSLICNFLDIEDDSEDTVTDQENDNEDMEEESHSYGEEQPLKSGKRMSASKKRKVKTTSRKLWTQTVSYQYHISLVSSYDF